MVACSREPPELSFTRNLHPLTESYTLHPAPYTLTLPTLLQSYYGAHPLLETYTLYPAPYSLHPTPCTLTL